MQALRWILFPFAIIYGLITELRNLLYDAGIFRTYSIPVKSLCVGNLSVGGTGKTPHVAWIAEMYCDRLNVVILSRGYGRKSHGFFWVDQNGSAESFGDEPLLYARKFQERIRVAVCEKRKDGVRQILTEFPKTDLILLDDAFQHRQVKAGLNILLTDYSMPYFKDWMLPTGNLREIRLNSKRADVIVVAKCPELSERQESTVLEKINHRSKHIFFSSVAYAEPVSFNGQNWNRPEKILLVTGIANPKPLLEKLSGDGKIEHIKYPDHHTFSVTDIQEIHQKFDNFGGQGSVILTTEKDFVRLTEKMEQTEIRKYPWYYIPISVRMKGEEEFKSIIDQYVGTV